MHQTLLTIPSELGGAKIFGFGWLLALWALGALAILGWSFVKQGWQPALGYVPLLAALGAAIAWVIPAAFPEGLPIRGYGVMLLVAVGASVAFAAYRARQVGLDPEIMLSLGTWFFVAGFLGARLFYVIEYWQRFQKSTLVETLLGMINITQGGLVVYGSLLAGGAALVVFVHKNRLPGLAFTDLIAPCVVLGVGLGRIGCFLNGCCYGGLCDLPWAVSFPENSPAYLDQAQHGARFLHGLVFKGSQNDPPIVEEVEAGSPAERQGLRPGQKVVAINGRPIGSVEEAQLELFSIYGAGTKVAVNVAGEKSAKSWTISGAPPRSLPVHPTQLYSLLDALLLCLFLLAYEPYKTRDGELTALVLVVHPISRFLLEIIRVDESAVFNTGMSISQNISLAIFAGGIALWLYILNRPARRAWPGFIPTPSPLAVEGRLAQRAG